MHILEIPSFFTPYGGEFCLEQARALHARGHEVRILSNVQLSIRISRWQFFRFPYRRQWTNVQGVEVYQSYQHALPKWVRLNVERWVSIVCSMMDDYVHKHGLPDVLHAHCVKWAGYAAMVISRKYGIPYVVTEHLPREVYEREFGAPPSTAWQIPMLKEALQQARRVITVSEELKDELSVFFGTDYQSVTVSNTVDVGFFAYRSRAPREGRPFRFCCLAIFDERKGYGVLLDAFERLSGRGMAVELHVAGRGTDGEGFSLMCAGLHSRQRIHSHGELDKEGVRALLYACDALALATRGETQGLVLLEALSTGIPVVSTEAIPRSVRLTEASWYVGVDDARGLADVMGRLVTGELGYDGRKASEQVRQMASPEVIGCRVETVLRASTESR